MMGEGEKIMENGRHIITIYTERSECHKTNDVVYKVYILILYTIV